jgi:hypothetical protein
MLDLQECIWLPRQVDLGWKDAVMDMDFSTRERLEDVEVFQIDDLPHHEVGTVSDSSEVKRDSWFSLFFYWIAELRWRAKFWNQTRR